MNGKPVANGMLFDKVWEKFGPLIIAVVTALLIRYLPPGTQLPPVSPPSVPAPPVTPTPPPPPAPVVPRIDAVQATAKLSFKNGHCTCTVIHPQTANGMWHVLSAAHCSGGVGTTATVCTKDNTCYTARCVWVDTKADLSWYVMKGPPTLYSAVLSDVVPTVGDMVWHCGYGVDKPGNTEFGTVTVTGEKVKQYELNLSVSSGDSGSGIFDRNTGKLLCVVCCTSGMRCWAGTAAIAAANRPRDFPIFLLTV